MEVEPGSPLASLQERFERIRQAEVAKALGRLPHASADTRAAIEVLSSDLVNRILSAPALKLRESSRRGRGRRWALLVSELFGLERASGTRG